MKILLLEYITGGGLAGLDLPDKPAGQLHSPSQGITSLRRDVIPPQPVCTAIAAGQGMEARYDSLAREGLLMSVALAADLLALPDVALLIPWDARLPLPTYAADTRVKFMPVADAATFQRCWVDGLAECDAAWPVAPETDGVLGSLCLAVEQTGCRLLNSSSAGVSLAASKCAMGERLATHGIATLPSYPLHGQPVDMSWPRVVKPDDGVGCDGVCRVDSPALWAKRFATGTAAGNLLVQPFMEGPSLSLSALFYRGGALLLAVNRQLIEVTVNGAFQLTGCEVNSVADEAGEYADLARRIACAVPELAGYVGVDFILGPQGPVVLEINPRLTSSYAALGRALGLNPARLVLDLFERSALPSVLLGAGRALSVAW